MGGQQMLSSERTQVVKSVDQHPRVTVFLSPDGEDVKERRPHQVVNRHAQLREPEGHGIISVRGRRRHRHLKPGDVYGDRFGEGMVGGNVTGR